MANNTKTATSVNSSTAVNISVGSGIAIAAIWFFATVLSVLLILLCFTDVFAVNTAAPPKPSEEVDESDVAWAFIICVAISLLPSVVAFWLTAAFMNGNDDD